MKINCLLAEFNAATGRHQAAAGHAATCPACHARLADADLAHRVLRSADRRTTAPAQPAPTALLRALRTAPAPTAKASQRLPAAVLAIAASVALVLAVRSYRPNHAGTLASTAAPHRVAIDAPVSTMPEMAKVVVGELTVTPVYEAELRQLADDFRRGSGLIATRE